MTKVAVLGAGISGLSIGRQLMRKFDVEVLEMKGEHGGIARTTDVDGIAYHTVGGHCFNSKYKDVIDFVFQEVLPIENWHKVKRLSKIKFHNFEIPYPIEFSIQKIHAHDKDLAREITIDFFRANDDGKYGDLEEWFRKKFGNRLANGYFIPYNQKIWNKAPKDMDPSWVEDKLPIPSKEQFFEGLMNEGLSDSMPHSEFYYPNSNNQNTFIDALAKGLRIHYDYCVSSVKYDTLSKKWMINNEKSFDIVINTTPLNRFVGSLEGVPEVVREAANQLKTNGISNVLWRSDNTNKTWTYLPNPNTLFHRYIHIGSFFNPVKPYTITESVGYRTKEEMIQAGSTDPFLNSALGHNYEELAYVVFDSNYKNATTLIKDYLNEIGLFTLGRFGEWQYYNMDVCIKKAIDLARLINKD